MFQAGHIYLAPRGWRVANIFNHFFLCGPQIHINGHKKCNKGLFTYYVSREVEGGYGKC